MGILYGVAIATAILGALCAAFGKVFVANCIWVFANFIFVIKSILEADWYMLILFSVYLCIAVFGVINLWPSKRNK